MERNQPRSLACVPWPRLDLSLLKIHYSWFSALSGPRLQPYVNGVINAVVFEQFLPFCAGLYFWSPENQPPDGTRCGKLGQNPNFFWKSYARRLPLSRNINFNYHPSSIPFSISFADLDILYSARSLRDLSTIQILAETPQQTRLISRRLSWEDPDLFINIHNMHIGTHTFYKYTPTLTLKIQIHMTLWLALVRTQMKSPFKFSLLGLFQNFAFGSSTLTSVWIRSMWIWVREVNFYSSAPNNRKKC